MKKCFLVFLALLLLISPCLAYSVPDDTIVYVTNTGTKYHRDGCSYLHSSRPMTIQQAEAAGYGPCSVCKADRKTGRYESNLGGQSSSSSSHAGAGETPTVRPAPTPVPDPAPSPAPDSDAGDDSFYGLRVFLAVFICVAPFFAYIFWFGRRRK